MRVLFVCRGNIGRSQVAAAFYHQLKPKDAESAGTIVDPPNQLLSDRPGARVVISVMKDYGIDISEHRSSQITEDMIRSFDKVIIMAEKETIPEYLLSSPKSEVWEIEDIKGKNKEEARMIAEQIRTRVRELSKEGIK